MGSKCASTDAVFVYQTALHVNIPKRGRKSALKLVPLNVRVPALSSDVLSELEILNAGRIFRPVRRRLGTSGAVREFGETVCLAARVVRSRHEQNWVKVERLPGPCYRLSIADETTIHFTCNHTHQSSEVKGNPVLCQVGHTGLAPYNRFLTFFLDIEFVYIMRLDKYE